MKIVHGGNVYELSALAGCSPDDILDFSASINPLGPPSGLTKIFSDCFHRIESYPDIHNRLLIKAISEFHDIDPDFIAVANGSTELIYWLPHALGINEALVALPTFSEYPKAFELRGTRLQKLFSTPQNFFQPKCDQIAAALHKGDFDAVLLTNPGSPSGSLLDEETVKWIINQDPNSKRPLFVIDEVFVDFCERNSLKRFFGKFKNIALIRSFTKFYGLPGLRIGYLLAPPPITALVRNHIPPWSVSTFAQAAGVYCLTRSEYRQKSLDLIESERQRLAGELRKIDGLEVFPANANYLLVRIDPGLKQASSL